MGELTLGYAAPGWSSSKARNNCLCQNLIKMLAPKILLFGKFFSYGQQARDHNAISGSD
jgi:hypothetical protein